MRVLVVISTLFIIGSVAGFVIELFYRRFVSQKRWANPGFMVGPYIPLYGFGVMLLFTISNFGIAETSLPEWAKILIILAIIGLMMTVIELIAGLIFIRGMHIKLWDYSNRWGNFKGVICPLFSFIWFAVGSLYYFFLNPFLIKAIENVHDNAAYDFFIGAVIGMMVVDFAYSLHLGLKIRKVSENMVVRFESFKASVNDTDKESGEKRNFFFLRIQSNDHLKKYFENYKNKDFKVKQWWKRKKETNNQDKNC